MRRSLLKAALAISLGLSTPGFAQGETKPPAKGEAQQQRARYFEGRGATAEEQALYEELSQAIEAYEAESRDLRREVQLLIEKK